MKLVGISGQAGSGKDTVADYLVSEYGYVKVSLADPIKRFGREVFGFTDTQLWGPSHHRNELDKRFDYYCDLRSGGIRFTPKTKLGALAATCDKGWFVAAHALKEYAEEWLDQVLPGEDVQSLYDWFAAFGSVHARISPRVMLQHLGTEWGREAADEDIWVNCMLRTAKAILNGQQYDRRVGLTGNDPKATPTTGVVVSDVRFKNELEAIRAAGGLLVRIQRPKTDKKATKTGIENHASETEQQQFKDEDFQAVLINGTTIKGLFRRIDAAVKDWEMT